MLAPHPVVAFVHERTRRDQQHQLYRDESECNDLQQAQRRNLARVRLLPVCLPHSPPLQGITIRPPYGMRKGPAKLQCRYFASRLSSSPVIAWLVSGGSAHPDARRRVPY